MRQTTPDPGTSAPVAGVADVGVEPMSQRMLVRIQKVQQGRRMKPSPMMQPQMAVHVMAAHEEAVTAEAARSKRTEQMRIQPLMQPKAPGPILKQMTMMVVETAAAAVAFAVPARLLHRS